MVIWHSETNDRVKQDFIPNDVALGGELPNLVLLTGANMVHPLSIVLIQGRKIHVAETDLRSGYYGPSWMLCSGAKS
jgi:hypothetical protein